MSSRAARLKKHRARALRTRNLHRQIGREVTQAEALSYARPGHQACKAIIGKPAGVVFNPRRGTYHYCRCVTERLIEAHPEVILYEDGRAFWPAEDEDDEDDAQEDVHVEQQQDPEVEAPGDGRRPGAAGGLRAPGEDPDSA